MLTRRLLALGLSLASWVAAAQPIVSAESSIDAPIVGPTKASSTGVQLAFDGTQYLAVWVEHRSGTGRVVAARIASDGTLLDPTNIELSAGSGDQNGVAVASSGSGFYVVYSVQTASGGFLYGTRVAADGTVLDPNGIPLAPVSSLLQGALTFGGGQYLLTYLAPNGADPIDIWAMRIDLDGNVLDPGGVLIAAVTANQFRPKVAYSSGVYLVVWQDHRSDIDVYGARIDTLGTPLDLPSGFYISNSATFDQTPDVIAGAGQFFVAWSDGRNLGGGDPMDLYGSRVTPGGVVLDIPSLLISSATSFQESPALAFDGTNYWASWFHRETPLEIYGGRVTTGGARLDGDGVLLSTAPGAQSYPALVAGSSQLLVAWTGWEGVGPFAGAIGGTRLGPTGSALDPQGISISNAANDQEHPAACFGGGHHWVVWVDTRSGQPQLFGMRLSPAGAPLEAAPLAIETSAASFIKYTRIACRSDGAALAAWVLYDGTDSSTRAALLAADGGLASTPVVLAVNPWASYPAVASDGSGFMVAWSWGTGGPTGLELAATRVDGTSGTVLDNPALTLSTGSGDQHRPALAWDGSVWNVLWEDTRAGNSDIRWARIDSAGTVLDGTGQPVAEAVGAEQLPFLAYANGVLMGGWVDTTSNPAKLVTGVMQGSGGIAFAPTVDLPSGPPAQGELARAPQLIHDGTDFIWVWEITRPDVLRGSDWDIVGGRIAADGTLLDATPATLSGQRGLERWPVLTSDRRGSSLLLYSRYDSSAGVRSLRLLKRTLGVAWPGQLLDVGWACSTAVGGKPLVMAALGLLLVIRARRRG